MLKSVHLKNFRQHADLEVNFNDGMMAIRGENEKGKSTIFEAVTYAWFGVRSCRNNDIVRWGAVPSSMKITARMSIAGTEYVVTRSLAGAEINWDAGKVSGQTDVTRFIENLFGMQPGSGGKLMFAGQNEIRGVLKEGDAATATLIEKLANLSVIDDLIKTVQDKCATGNPGKLETLIAEQRQRAADLRSSLTQPDEAAHQTQLAELTVAVQRALAAQQDANDELTAVREAIAANSAETAAYEQLKQQADSAGQQVSRLLAQQTKLEGELATCPAPERLAELESQVTEAEQAETKAQARRTLDRYLASAKINLWAGTKAELEATITSTSAAVDAGKAAELVFTRDLTKLRAERDIGTACSFCGKDFSDVPEVAAKLDDLSRQIADKEGLTIANADGVREQSWRLIELRAALREETAETLAARWPQFIQLAETGWPPAPSWIGGDVPEAVDPPALRAKLQSTRTALAGKPTLESTLARCLADLGDAEARNQELNAKLLATPKPAPITELSARRVAALESVSNADQLVRDCQKAVNDQTLAFARAQAEYEQKLVALEQAKAMVEETQSALDDLVFNNTLLKRLREIKPEVANHLWNTILGAVSRYFSMMRGVKSTVARTPDGFTVDGHPVESYSGSALDVLGLAIRVALTKTFLPTVQFLFLDEPFSACSDERQTNSLGFLAGLGYDQVLVITHEDTTEAVADSLLTLQ